MTDRGLKSIELEGYASIRSARVELGRLNVLIGANGAGMSNFVRVFELLGRLIEEDRGFFVGLNGGASALLTSGAARLRIALDGAAGRAPVKQLVPTADNLALHDDAGNLAAVLLALADRDDMADQAAYRRIIGVIGQAAPFPRLRAASGEERSGTPEVASSRLGRRVLGQPDVGRHTAVHPGCC